MCVVFFYAIYSTSIIFNVVFFFFSEVIVIYIVSSLGLSDGRIISFFFYIRIKFRDYFFFRCVGKDDRLFFSGSWNEGYCIFL